MGDEDKIKDLVPLAKAEFLPEEVKDSDPGVPDYSLDKEFAKAKSNKDYLFYAVIVVFLATVIGGSIAYTQILQARINKQKASFVDVEFNVELKNLLTSTQEEQKKVNEAKEDLNNTINERDKKIDAIKVKYSERIDVINAKNIPQNEKDDLIASLKAEKVKETEAVEKEYEPQINEKKQNVVKYETLYQRKQEKMQAEINKAESIVSNAKQLHQMQMDRQEANLILKYNPVYSETQLRRILRDGTRGTTMKSPQLRPYEVKLYEAGLLSKSEHELVRKKIEEYQLLVERMQKIPYTNSVRPSIDVLQDSGFFIITQYERLLEKLSIRISYQNALINKYRNAFRHYAETSPDSGMVIDASDKSNVLLMMKPLLDIVDGDEAYIFRTEDDLIGTVVFTKDNGSVKVVVKEVLPGRQIRPFDKVFLKRKLVEPESTGGEKTTETPADEKSEPTNNEEAP